MLTLFFFPPAVAPSSAAHFVRFLRHSHSKSVRLGVASASLARASLAALPAAAAAALDLGAAAAMLACFVTAKSAEARAEAAAMSRRLAEARGLAEWAAAVRAECKPAVARGLLAGLGAAGEAPAAAEDEPGAGAGAGADSAAAVVLAAGPLSPCRALPASLLGGVLAFAGSPSGGFGAGGRVPSLAQYLRERSSQRRRRGGGGLAEGEASAAAAAATPLALGPFSPSLLGAGRRGRASKSPVLVLKREQMLAEMELAAGAGGGGGGGAEAIVEVDGEGC